MYRSVVDPASAVNGHGHNTSSEPPLVPSALYWAGAVGHGPGTVLEQSKGTGTFYGDAAAGCLPGLYPGTANPSGASCWKNVLAAAHWAEASTAVAAAAATGCELSVFTHLILASLPVSMANARRLPKCTIKIVGTSMALRLPVARRHSSRHLPHCQYKLSHG